MQNYDCAIVGGGLAGLQAAIQLGRYQHRIIVVDDGIGRSTICRCYRNLLGWPDGVSGTELLKLGREQALRLGVEFYHDRVVHAAQHRETIMLDCAGGERIVANRLLLATGVQDRIPIREKLAACLGLTVFVCPDCDGYEVKDKRVVVLGSGNPGASMALTLRWWTSDIVYINHEGTKVDEQLLQQLAASEIRYVEESIAKVAQSDGKLQGVQLERGTYIEARFGFVAFGRNNVRSELAKQLALGLTEQQHIEVDYRTKMTTNRHVWAAGDVTAHSEQAIIAMGDGAQAAIWIHKSLLQ